MLLLGWRRVLKNCVFPGFSAMDLEYRFATTYSLLCLHVWLILVRLRAEGKNGKDLAQMMYENFQEDVELRVRAEGVKVHFKSGLLSCTHQSVSAEYLVTDLFWWKVGLG